jgi:UDP-N-acetyl-D-mannosaminuronate dehydrogenase
MKDQKTLKAAGDFLAQTQFGVAVVVVSTGMDGDTQKDLVLTEARAMVIPMELGMIGLGRMGTNMVRRLMRAGHQCVVYDIHSEAVQSLAKEGAVGAIRLKTS